jgi:uncharacterized membrane-anchored protein
MRPMASGVAAAFFIAAILVIGPAQAQTPAPAAPPTAEQVQAKQAAEDKRLDALQATLQPRYGNIALPEAKATLHLGVDYFFLGPDDARKVLIEAWGNPPDEVEGVLGMIFPKDATAKDNPFGVVVTYDPSGYVTDEAATQKDYDKLLADMKSGSDERNTERAKKVDPVTLMGWAQPPSYDRQNNNLIWARHFAFGSAPVHTLNYDVRHLGRTGVLSMNFVAAMPALEKLRPVAAELAKAAEFDAGQRYADHKSGDKAAGYGLVGLIGAGAGLLVAKKIGLIGIGLLFLKKFAVVIVAAFAGAGAWVRRVLGLKPKAAKKPAVANFDQPETQALEAHTKEDDPVA